MRFGLEGRVGRQVGWLLGVHDFAGIGMEMRANICARAVVATKQKSSSNSKESGREGKENRKYDVCVER